MYSNIYENLFAGIVKVVTFALFLINLNKKPNTKLRMKKVFLSLSLLAAGGLMIVACSDDDNSKSGSKVTKEAVVANYADIVYQNYKDAYDDAVELETAITAFTAAPTADGFTAARIKWKQARESYGTTEAFRFANGPIDDEKGPEGLLNSWPLDENFIDYVDNNGAVLNGGIINRTDLYPTISKAVLEGLNEDGGEKNISVGYHAIEFLLWGQDLTAPAENKPGQRLYTDYIDGSTTALNPARRRDYLKICADLLTDHLDYLVQLWKPGGTYRATFLALPVTTALQNIYLGITTLSGEELATERMDVALTNQDQEDEHSCFSDNTHRDIALNLQGVVNVYEGKYGVISGASLRDLVKQSDSQFYDDTNNAVEAAKEDVMAIYIPFDYAISGGASSAEGAKVKKAVVQLKTLQANLLAGATAIGVVVND